MPPTYPHQCGRNSARQPLRSRSLHEPVAFNEGGSLRFPDGLLPRFCVDRHVQVGDVGDPAPSTSRSSSMVRRIVLSDNSFTRGRGFSIGTAFQTTFPGWRGCPTGPSARKPLEGLRIGMGRAVWSRNCNSEARVEAPYTTNYDNVAETAAAQRVSAPVSCVAIRYDS